MSEKEPELGEGVIETKDVIEIIKRLPRSSWGEYFMMQAFLAASRSPSEKLKVGAIITSGGDHRVLSTGYNGYFSGMPHKAIHRVGSDGHSHEINTAHAEANAILYSARKGTSIEGGTIYVTHYPCINCTKSIIASGIERVYYYEDYKNDDACAELFAMAGISVIKLAFAL